MQMTDIFQLSSEELQALLHGEAAVIPELAGKTPQQLRALPAASMILDHCGTLMDGIEHIPQTGYSAYRLFKRYGERKTFERPYLLKRANLAAAVTRLLLGETETPAGTSLKDLIQDYLWNICEESNWILPAHEEFNIIDLFVAETGYQLALTLHLLGETLDGEVRSRVRAEIERRVFDPYLRFYSLHRWYKGPNNWTGVCNGAVAATFLLLEPEQQRTAQALKLALAGLETYLDRAFEKDGTSTEGVEYWQYGLTYFIILAEMLYSRSQGVLNLLGSPLMQKIAVYPAALQLTGSNCASFADCDEEVFLSHGLLSRLALRTGQRAQLQLMPRQLQPLNRTSLASLLCDLLWWDGRWLETSAPQDSLLPLGNIGRLVAQTQDGAPVVLAFKAGHNNEHHNHNDIGSFILHSAGENLLADPGRGLYSRANFDSRRYQNIFNNSYGHSVPRLAGQLQPPGEQYYGTLSEIERDDTSKAIEIDFTHAYALPQLQEARRHLQLITEGKENGTLLLRDNFIFTQPTEVEEAFSTWFDTRIEGSTATILGQWQGLSMAIEEPAGATFQVEQLEQESRENQKSGVLKRITVTLPPDREQQVRIRMRPFTRQEA